MKVGELDTGWADKADMDWISFLNHAARRSRLRD